MAVGGNREVVTKVELRGALALEEQLEPIGRAGKARGELEDLAQVPGSAAGAAGEHRVLANVQPFAARQQRRAIGRSALAQVVVRRFDLIQIDSAHREGHAHRHGR